MSDNLNALSLDLLEWLEVRPRPYREVMEAWRTSCPALAVWEHVSDKGFVARNHRQGSGIVISLTPSGRAYVEQHRAASWSVRSKRCRAATQDGVEDLSVA